MSEATNKEILESLYTFNPQVGTFSSGSTASGEFIEDTQVLKGLVEAIFKKQFGMDAPDPATPMGRLIEQLAILFANSMRVNVQNANQLVLSAAAGQQLDAIALWFGLYRKPAVSTTVTATLTGSPDTTLYAGSRARTEEGAVFVLTEDITFPTEPNDVGVYQATAVFRALETGSIGCPAHTLTTIDTPVSGWLTVTNEEDGVLGRETETDDSLRARIEASRFHGNGFIYSMKNAIEAIDGVNSSMVVENYTGEVKTVHGVDDMAPHSIFVCVDCPDTDLPEVAQAVFDQKPCGTAYHQKQGTQEGHQVPVVDAYGNSYDVYLHTPEKCYINISMSVKNRSYTGSDMYADIASAVEGFFDEHEYKIGEDVFAADITRAVENALPGIIVVACGVTDGGTAQSGTDVSSLEYLAYQEVAAYQKAFFDRNDSARIKISEI